MLEVVVFAVVLVVSQVLAGFAIMHIMFSKGFIKYYSKKMMTVMEDIQEEMEKMAEKLYKED